MVHGHWLSFIGIQWMLLGSCADGGGFLVWRTPTGGEKKEDVLEVQRRVDVEPEAEVNVESRVRKLLVVVGCQRMDLLVLTREEELAVLYGRQAEEHHIVDVDPQIIHHQLQRIPIRVELIELG